MLRRLLPLAFVTLGLTVPIASVAAQPFTQGAAASAISAANALSARIRGYHRWQGLTPPPASYCATMREGEAVLKQLSRLASRAILYRAPGLALSLQQAGDRLSDELDEEEEVNSQSGIQLHALPLSGTGAVSAARARAQDPRRKGAFLSQASGCGSRVVRRAPRADAEVPANTGNVAVILAPASSFSRGALW